MLTLFEMLLDEMLLDEIMEEEQQELLVDEAQERRMSS